MVKNKFDWSKIDARNKKQHSNKTKGNPEMWKEMARKLFSDSPSNEEYLMVLGLSSMPTSKKELQKARNEKLMTVHPDVGGTMEDAQKVNCAYEILKGTID